VIAATPMASAAAAVNQISVSSTRGQ
jgi:hypothetical protein